MTAPRPRATDIVETKPLVATAITIWVLAALATAVPLVGFALLLTTESAPSWLGQSLPLLLSLPATVGIMFVLALTVCIVKRAALWDSLRASLGFAFFGLFVVVTGMFQVTTAF